MSYGSCISKWKPWKWVMRDHWGMYASIPIWTHPTKFSTSSKSIESKYILSWNISQLIVTTASILSLLTVFLVAFWIDTNVESSLFKKGLLTYLTNDGVCHWLKLSYLYRTLCPVTFDLICCSDVICESLLFLVFFILGNGRPQYGWMTDIKVFL